MPKGISNRIKFPYKYTSQDATGEIGRLTRKLRSDGVTTEEKLILLINGGYMAACIANSGKKYYGWIPILDKAFEEIPDLEFFVVKVEATLFKPVMETTGNRDSFDTGIFITRDDLTPRWWMLEVINERPTKVTLFGSNLDGLNLGGK